MKGHVHLLYLVKRRLPGSVTILFGAGRRVHESVDVAQENAPSEFTVPRRAAHDRVAGMANHPCVDLAAGSRTTGVTPLSSWSPSCPPRRLPATRSSSGKSPASRAPTPIVE